MHIAAGLRLARVPLPLARHGAPAPHRTLERVNRSRTGARRALIVALSTITVAALAVGGYTAACALAPLPAPTIELSPAFTPGDDSAAVSADPAAAQAAVDAQSLPTAIGYLHGDEVWANDPTAHPLASISKLITVLVCMEAQPLEPGSDGPVYTWTEADRERQDAYLALDGVAYPIPVGTEITLRQMLHFIFLPSANDYAAAYAYWTFGDDDAFLAAVADWKQRHGLESLQFVEPTGMDEANMASAPDVLRIARLALQNPAVAEFTRTTAVEMPWGVGVIENTNPLLTEMPGIIGVKTGRSGAAGFNFAVARQVDVDGREVVQLSVTLGRESKEARAQSGRDMLAAHDTLPQSTAIVEAGTTVGEAVTVDGTRIPLVTAGGAAVTLLPGEQATRAAAVDVAALGEAGARVGAVTVEGPAPVEDVAVVASAAVAEPELWWRLTHPVELFGW